MRVLDVSRRFATRSLKGGPAGLACAGLWIVALVLIEALGRRSPSDLGDALGALGIVGLVLITSVWHREVGLPWVGSLSRTFGRFAESVLDRQASIGIDFRAGTLDPFGYPRLLKLLLCGTLGLAAVGWFWPGSPIEDLRAALAGRFYVGYLVVLTALWGGLLFLTLTTLLLFAMVVHDAFVARSLDPRNRSLRIEALTLFGTMLGVTVAGFVLPPTVPLIVAFALLGVLLVVALLPVTHPVKMVWKSKSTGGELRGVSVRWLSAMEGIQLVLGVAAFAFLALGNILFRGAGAISETTPVTEVLGRVLAWTGTLGGGAYLVFVLSMMWLGFRLDPRKPTRPTLHVDGLDLAVDRRRVTRLFRAIGWKTRFAPAAARRPDVRIRIVDQAGTAVHRQTRWPIVVSREEIGRRVVLDRLARRDEIQKRRRLLKGLERLFKLVGKREYQRGEGFWIGVHHWFILGLSRDESEDEFDRYRDTWMRQHVGPSFGRCIDWPARQHLHHILWCADIDLIFLEDGIGFRGLQRVIRILFEIYDTYGGSRRLEEKMLHGIPKVRALIQEVGLEQSLDSEVYPEPDYEDVGRARVLHLFKDRGGDKDTVEAPAEFDRIPIATF